MAMSPKLRNSVLAAVGGGAIAIASALITGPTGNDGLEGVRYNPYQDVVGVWTVCYGHTGKDIMLGKKYTEAGYARPVRRYAKMVRKVVRKRVRRVPAKSLPALDVRKKVRNQNPNLHQIRNRYAGCVPIRRLTHFNPATSRR